MEAFAVFLIVRRQLQQPQLLTDDISVQELTELVAASGGFDWLNAEEEKYILWETARPTMAQSIVKRGSVVLIRYPFTDLTAKVRPALVVTPDHLLPRLEDVLCCSSLLQCRTIFSQPISCWNPGIPRFRRRGSSVVRCSECTNSPYCIKCSYYVFWARESDRSCPKSINGYVWRWACKDMTRKPRSV